MHAMDIDAEAMQTRHSGKRHDLLEAVITGALELKRVCVRVLKLVLHQRIFYGFVLQA